MNNHEDSNYVSIRFWMFAMLVTAIPVVGWIMIFVWAFAGNNESRKNYFKAILAWILLAIAFFVVLILVAGWPQIEKQIQDQIHHTHQSS
jgi:heme/copper-type cytochrome/quinol oxidase subunit 2